MRVFNTSIRIAAGALTNALPLPPHTHNYSLVCLARLISYFPVRYKATAHTDSSFSLWSFVVVKCWWQNKSGWSQYNVVWCLYLLNTSTLSFVTHEDVCDLPPFSGKLVSLTIGNLFQREAESGIEQGGLWVGLKGWHDSWEIHQEACLLL